MFKEFDVSFRNEVLNSSTSKGTQRKWVVDDFLIKADMLGYESIAEVVVADFLSYVDNIDFVDYSLCNISIGDSASLTGCYSKYFLKSGEEYTSFQRLLKLFYGSEKKLNLALKGYQGKDKCREVISIVRDLTGLDVSCYVSNMLKIDALILNEDRHFNNMGVIKGINYWRLCPIFDNGLSLLSDTNDYPFGTPVRFLCNRVKAKPFSTDFIKQSKYIDNSLLVIDFKSFRDDLSSKYVEFKNKEFMRATSVLLSRCSKLEGIIWEQKK